MVMDRLEAALNLPENSSHKKQAIIKAVKTILENAEIADPGMPVKATPSTPTPSISQKPPEENGSPSRYDVRVWH